MDSITSSTGHGFTNTNVNFQLTGLTPETYFTILRLCGRSPTDAWSSQQRHQSPLSGTTSTCGGFLVTLEI
jgi:hypothetical protein